MRVIAAASLLLLFATGARGQAVSVAAGGFTYEGGTDPVVEVFTALPLVFERVRPYAIWSWNLNAGSAKPVIVGEFDFTLYRRPATFLWNVGTGGIFQPSKDYDPEWITTTTVVWKPWGRLGFVVIGSIQPTVDNSWGLVWKMDYTLAFRS